MPEAKIYADNASRQKAYRERQAAARKAELAEKGLPPIPAIPTMPSYARWNTSIQKALALIEQTYEEMTAYYEERSENWQESDKGTDFETKTQALSEAIESLTSTQP